MTTAQKPISLLPSSYAKENLEEASIAKLINLYLEEIPHPSYGSKIACLQTPGAEEWVDLTGNAHRGCISHKNIGYWVVDNKVYKTTSAGVQTTIGTITTYNGRVSMAALNDFIVLVDGTAGWYYKISTAAFTQITDPDFPAGCSKILGLSEFIVYFKPSSNQAYISDISAPQTIGALSVISNSLESDNLISGVVANQILYLLGDYHCEPWYVSGGQTVPFDHTSQTGIEIGIAAPNAHLAIGDTAWWLAKTKEGLQGIGYANSRSFGIIPNRDFANKIKRFYSISDCYFWSDSYNQHIFLNMTFPSAVENQRGYTIYYDISTGFWGERESYNFTGIMFPTADKHFASCSMSLDGMQLIGDTYSGKIFKLDTNIYDEDGNDITRVLIGPSLNTSENRILTLSELELHIKRGVGRVSGTLNATNPKMNFFLSRDGGNTFGDADERDLSLTGDYEKRLIWAGCGGGRNLVPKLSWSSPVPITIVAATAMVK